MNVTSAALVMCAVCFRGSDPVMADSLNAGILVLLGITGVVLGGFGYFFVRLAQRSRAAAHLVGADRPDAFVVRPNHDFRR